MKLAGTQLDSLPLEGCLDLSNRQVAVVQSVYLFKELTQLLALLGWQLGSDEGESYRLEPRVTCKFLHFLVVELEAFGHWLF